MTSPTLNFYFNPYCPYAQLEAELRFLDVVITTDYLMGLITPGNRLYFK